MALPPQGQNPFMVLTFLVAPAILTNACSLLALSTTNRMLRTRDSMTNLLAQSSTQALDQAESDRLLISVNRVETQAGLLLGALRAIYLALGSFSSATLVTLVAAAFVQIIGSEWLAFVGILLGAFGVACLVFGNLKLFHATQISLANIHDEAQLIRARANRQ